MNDTLKIQYDYKSRGTAVNCDETGHCWHGGTAVGSLYCCKCGRYLYPSICNFDIRLTYPNNLSIYNWW